MFLVDVSEKSNNLMKKVLLFILMIMCMFLFVGCDDDDESTDYKVLVEMTNDKTSEI